MTSKRNRKRSAEKAKNTKVVQPAAKAKKAVEETSSYLEHKMNKANKDTMGESTPIMLEKEKIKSVVETIKSVLDEMSVISVTKIGDLKKRYIAERAKAVEKAVERVEKEKTVASLTAILETMLAATQATVSETIELAEIEEEEKRLAGVREIISEAPKEAIEKKEAGQEKDLEALAQCSSKMLKGMAIVLEISSARLSAPENEQASTGELMVIRKILEIGEVLSTVIESIAVAHCDDYETKGPTLFDSNITESLKSASYKVLEIAECLIKKDGKVELSEEEYANSVKEIDKTLEIIKGFIEKDDKAESHNEESASSDKDVAFLSATDKSIISVSLTHSDDEEQRSAELKDVTDVCNKNGEPAEAVTHERHTEETKTNERESLSEQDAALEELARSNKKSSDILSNQALSIKNTIIKALEAAEQIIQTVDCVSSVKEQVEKLRRAVQELKPELAAMRRGKNPILSTPKSVGEVSKRALRLVKEMTEAEPAVEVSTIVATTVSAMKLAKMELGLFTEMLQTLWLVYQEEEVREKAEPLSVFVRETACSVSETVRHTHDSMEEFISVMENIQSQEDDVETIIATVKSLTNTIIETLRGPALIVGNIFSLASPPHTQAYIYSQDLLEDISQRLDYLAKELVKLTTDKVDATKRLEYLLEELGEQRSAEKTQQMLVEISEQLLEQKKPAEIVVIPEEKYIPTQAPLSSKEKFLICLCRTTLAIFTIALFLSSLYFLVVATNICYELASGRGLFSFPASIAHFTSNWLMVLAIPTIYCTIVFTNTAYKKFTEHGRELQGRASDYCLPFDIAVFAFTFTSLAFIMTAYGGYLFTLPGDAALSFAISPERTAVCLCLCACLSLALLVFCATSFLYTMSMQVEEHKKQTTEGKESASLPISAEDLCLPPETDIVSPSSETVVRSESAVVTA